MNIHEHQAKQILKKYGANVPEGVFAYNVSDLLQKTKELKTDKYVLKAQIHAGGRGKAGGVKNVIFASRQTTLFSFVKISGFISTKLASFSMNNL